MKESKTKTITSPPQYKTQAALTSRKNGAIKNSSSNGVLKLSQIKMRSIGIAEGGGGCITIIYETG